MKVWKTRKFNPNDKPGLLNELIDLPFNEQSFVSIYWKLVALASSESFNLQDIKAYGELYHYEFSPWTIDDLMYMDRGRREALNMLAPRLKA